MPTRSPTDRLIDGYKAFHAEYYQHRPELFEKLSTGQAPQVMVIACSDSRVDPAILLGTQPGEIFVVRNVANIVPPYAPSDMLHGTSAALEFAVRDLGVKEIVILGHSGCGGIRGLVHTVTKEPLPREFIGPWMQAVRPACDVLAGHSHAHGDADPDLSAVERAAIRVSLGHLRTFPWIKERVERGDLGLHGWWFDLATGDLMACQPETGAFAPVG
ncbi:MAG: carbonic anhydrase [Rhodospirillales bacterium]|nr:MAG: carbonic anhydrase [Rhodospirillales bacterium]